MYNTAILPTGHLQSRWLRAAHNRGGSLLALAKIFSQINSENLVIFLVRTPTYARLSRSFARPPIRLRLYNENS